MKLLRNVAAGVNQGVEMGHLLTEQQPFPYAAPFAGSLDYETQAGESTTLAVIHGFVPNEGTAWKHTFTHVHDFLERLRNSQYPKSEIQKSAPTNIYSLDFAMTEPPPIATELIGPYLALAEIMGRRVAELHLMLALDYTDPAIAPEQFNDFYRQSLYHGYIGLTSRRLEFLRQRYADMNADLRSLAANVLEQENAIIAKFRAVFERRIRSWRTRYHGRLHLGHLLITQVIEQGDVVMFDFEGDPHQHLSERRIKRCPLRDVASMLISFGYAAQTALRQILAAEGNDASLRHTLRIWGRFWYSHVSAAFVRGYWNTARNARYLPASQADQQTLFDTYLLERALLDLRADIEDKPELSGMPLRVILHLLDAESERRIGE